MSQSKTFDRQSDLARDEFERLHEGLRARVVVNEPIPRPVGARTFLGWIEEIQYRKDVASVSGAKTFSYWHPHESQAQPELSRDSRGKLFVRGRNYVVTDRGIEDMPVGELTRRSENFLPKRLVTLGTLEWIRYRSADGSSQILRFEGAARPLLAHDETGKLHVLRGRYQIEVNPMARRRRHHKHSAPRANPSKGGSSNMMKTAEKYGVAGLATAAAVFAGVNLLGYVSGMSWYRVTNPYLKAASVGVLGLASGILAYMYAPAKFAPMIGTGLIAGGGFAAMEGAWLTYRMRSGNAAGLFALPASRRIGVAPNAFARTRQAA